MPSLRNRLHRLIWVYDLEPLELLLGGITFLRGVNLLMPWDSFAVSHAYWLLSQWMTENQWGAAFTLVGTVQLVGLIQERKWRKWAHLACLWLWAALAVGFAIVEYRQVGTGLYLAFAAALFWIFARSGAR